MSQSSKKIISDVVLAPKKEITAQLFREPPPTIKYSPPQKKKKMRGKIFLVAAVLLAFFIIVTISVAKMEVRIAPKRNMLNIDQTITLSRNSKSEEELKFKSFSISLVKKAVFPATDKTSEASKAEGAIVVFNKGKDAQVLIASTRFEAPGGKIYRIPANIIVPAAKTENGKMTPGSKEVKVFADKPGPEYNIGLSDFTLPGLKGSPKFDLIFGRSKTEMKGGSFGERLIVGKEDKNSASIKLINEAKKDASTAAPAKLPQNEFLITPSVEYALLQENVLPAVGEEAAAFEISLEGEIRGASIDKGEFENFLVKKYPQINGDRTGLPVRSAGNIKIKNLDKLSVKILGYKFDSPTFKMHISGKAEWESVVNQDAVKNTIKEQKISDPGEILSAYPALSRAEVRFSPIWARPFKRYILTRPTAIDIVLE